MVTNTAASRQHHEGDAGHHGGSNRTYWTFTATLLVSLGWMWVLTMSMIRSLDHFYMQEILKRYE